MVAAVVVLAGVFAPGLRAPAGAVAGTAPLCSAWPEYGHDPDLTFQVPAECSAITKATVSGLVPAWFFHAHDSVTASPAVDAGMLYVGDWSGRFYALNAATGALRWTFQITVTDTLAFGQIVSSAVVRMFTDATTGHLRRVVIFGGGSTLWALDAATGRLLASEDLDPRTPALRRAEASNPPTVEIESSPVVATVPLGGRRQQVIYVGMDVHNGADVGPAGVVALQLASNRNGGWSFTPLWRRDAERGITWRGTGTLTGGSGVGEGCGDVWSSPAVDGAANEVVFGTGNCDNVDVARARGYHWSESMNAVTADTGAPLWRFQPAALLPDRASQDAAGYADDDFGASPNIFTLPSGERVVGEGQKSSVYWVRDLRTGAPVWSSKSGTAGNLQHNFAVGGFIGSTAVESGADGKAVRVIGGTAIPVPRSLTDVRPALDDVHAFDASTGRVAWAYPLGGPTYGSTSIVNGVAFVPLTVSSDVVGLDAATGLPLWIGPVVGPPSSTPVITGSWVYLGTGTSETDLEYKAIGLTLQHAFTDLIGQSPLSPLGGVQAFRLAAA